MEEWFRRLIMLTRNEYIEVQKKAAQMIRNAGIKMSDKEIDEIQVSDFGLNCIEKEGAQILTFFNTERVSAKIIVLFPKQTLPEHWHTSVGIDPGKEETFRVIEGKAYLYIPGEETVKEGFIPEGKEAYYTVRNEVALYSCDQMTLEPGVKHWIQAGEEGAVLYSFSSCARDTLDPFTDPNVVRITKIVEE